MKNDWQVRGVASGQTEFEASASTMIAAAVAIGATYFYFLIYAEFALLELAMPMMGEETWWMRGLMLALGAGGLGGSVWAGVRFDVLRVQSRLSWSFRGCAVGAALGLGAGNWPLLLVAAVVSGAALGMLTVNLAASLRPIIGTKRLGWVIGWGTGLAYACCNVPWIFEADPRTQTILAAGIAALASVLSPFMAPQEPSVSPEIDYRPAGVLRWVVVLMMLVWLDSAAFFVIQHEAGLKTETWTGSLQLWGNASVHLGLALVAGWMLDRGARALVAMTAFGFLAAGCVLLTSSPGGSAGWFYVAGVSLYSVLLVYYPARSGRSAVAAVVLGVGGWIGSALGIGMVQDMGRVPVEFVVVAGVLVAIMLVWRSRALRGAAVAGLCLMVTDPASAGGSPEDQVSRGRQVYIAEGCIHCHSQYVRPGTSDETRWGRPAMPEHPSPPLFGNRRQGPDLSTVGRRMPSAEWHRLHLMDPRQFQPRSRMPSYRHLFKADNAAGEALVAYLLTLGHERSS